MARDGVSWGIVIISLIQCSQILRRSTRESRQPERYRFVGLISQLDNDLKTYGEAMSDIDSDKWPEAMKLETDSMGSNQVWTLVDPPKGVKPVGCEGVYKCMFRADGEVTTFKARLMKKGYTQRPEVDFENFYSPVAMAKSIRILLAIAACEKVLKRFKMEKTKREFLPMRHVFKLSKKQSPKTDEELKRMSSILYASAVGSIQYVVQCTRPDVAYALSVTNIY
ncbi:Retrovirus-related Pol polyprotein from transposon RE2 [Sesamum angolense]|uniref:Retrovirus-related Pol polyprotein from transposon RE2 n=1 Tax=Sesamum angolense TaxID=2727404 RepID=A0AAE1X848_9LAMI|nr:Retrovirus-related Pol polyprotein from transposon RE2 [Sesamum angolense]